MDRHIFIPFVEITILGIVEALAILVSWNAQTTVWWRNVSIFEKKKTKEEVFRAPCCSPQNRHKLEPRTPRKWPPFYAIPVAERWIVLIDVWWACNAKQLTPGFLLASKQSIGISWSERPPSPREASDLRFFHLNSANVMLFFALLQNVLGPHRPRCLTVVGLETG